MVIKIGMKNSKLLDKNDDDDNDGGDDMFCEADNTFLSLEREAFDMRWLILDEEGHGQDDGDADVTKWFFFLQLAKLLQLVITQCFFWETFSEIW